MSSYIMRDKEVIKLRKEKLKSYDILEMWHPRRTPVHERTLEVDLACPYLCVLDWCTIILFTTRLASR